MRRLCSIPAAAFFIVCGKACAAFCLSWVAALPCLNFLLPFMPQAAVIPVNRLRYLSAAPFFAKAAAVKQFMPHGGNFKTCRILLRPGVGFSPTRRQLFKMFFIRLISIQAQLFSFTYIVSPMPCIKPNVKAPFSFNGRLAARFSCVFFM